MRKLLLHKLFLFAFCLIGLQSIYGQAFIVEDINPGVGWAGIEYKFRIGENFYFTATGITGTELWISDGTPNGTMELKDINPNPFASSSPENFIEYNGHWYFTANDGIIGNEIWKTDGTVEGTELAFELNPGPMGSDAGNFTIINGKMYFSADDGTNGNELWESDGTIVGTSMIVDVFVGPSNSFPKEITPLGTDIVFVANDGTSGDEIYITDGTSGTASLIKDINDGANSSSPTNLTIAADKIYFIADDGMSGLEVWRTDGTEGGTALTADIWPGIGNPGAVDFNTVGDFLFFVANNGTDGVELYRSDATAATPLSEIVEIFPDTFGATPEFFIHLNDDLLFSANQGGIGYELFKANGSDGSVELVKDIYPGFTSSSPVMLAVLNGEAFFKARGENIGFEIWKTDGTEDGTVLLRDLNTDPNSAIPSSEPTLPVVKDNILYFTATDYINGYQIWRTDGTSSATQRLTTIPHDTIFNNTHKPYFINNISNTVVNFVGLGDATGEELYGVDIDPVTIGNIQTNSPLTCNGDTNGTISLEVSGGVGDQSCFTFEWDTPGLSGLSLTDLAAGVYTLSVTDCVGFVTIQSITIEEPDAVSAETTQTGAISCYQAADGAATAMGTGGTGPYTFLWENGQTGATSTDLAAGNHNVTITDVNGCTGVQTALVIEPTQIILTTTPGEIICFGAEDGAATVAPIGGTPDYTYLWDNGEIGATATNLDGGVHTVTVTDINNCTAVSSVTIVTLPEVFIVFNTEDVSCINGANGTATALPGGGSGNGFSYSWTGGLTTATITDLGPGTYCVTVTDDAGCVNEDCTTIVSPVISVSQTGDVSCFGGSDGSAGVTITNANSTYTYVWDNGETTAIATMLGAGVHTVTITDLLACSTIETVTITEAAEFLLADSMSVSPSCFGAANGFISYNFSGGTAPYSYTWSTGEVNNNGILSGLVGDATYCVTITDANNCLTYNYCSTLTEPEQTTTSLINSSDVSCFDICNGTATVDIITGPPGTAYTFTWSSGETNIGVSSTASNLCAGMNTVTITNGACSYVETYILGGPDAIVATVEVVDATCFEATNGSVSAIATGGTAPYEYEFSSGTTDVPAGTYTLTVTDANGCTMVESYTVSQPTAIGINVISESPACIGDSDGSAAITAVGGTAPYVYEYSDNGPEDLPSGNYTVTITDSNGCTFIGGYSIDDPSPVVISNTVSNISCFGMEDGSVLSAATGGTAPYTFEYSGDTDSLAAGTYMVTATDANGCVFTESFMIVEPELLTLSLDPINVDCFGDSTGSVVATPAGGTAPYTFEYSDGSENLPVGDYDVMVTDANGCQTSGSFSISQPDLLVIENIGGNNVSCFGGNDGSLEIAVSGGVLPYNILGSVEDLPAGDHLITVIDGNSCSSQVLFTLTEPDMIQVEIVGVSEISCFGETDGSLDIEISGGTAPYQTDGDLTDLSSGNYTITITDANGCTEDFMFSMGQPAEITLDGSSTDATGSDADGTATVVPSGGALPYSYEWNTTPVQTTATATNLPAGDYEVTVTDTNGCTSMLVVTVDMFVNTVELDERLRFDIYPNPADEKVFLNMEFLETQQINLTVYDVLGRTVFQKALGNVQSQQFELDLQNFVQGVYWVQLSSEDKQFVRKLSVIKE